MQDPNPGETVLGVFARNVRGETVKTRLQTVLSRQEAERFHVASLADTLETALTLVPAPVLFLHAGEAAGSEDLRVLLTSLGFAGWDSLCVRWQSGDDLGLRLEGALAAAPALILGSDSPSLPPAFVRAGVACLGFVVPEVKGGAALRPHIGDVGQPRGAVASNRPDTTRTLAPAAGDLHAADLVLGPAADGGFWGIGLRRPCPGLLHDIAWGTERTFADTLARAESFGLHTELLPHWTDVDRPEDLHTLARQITMLRRGGDTRTARHSERFLVEFGVRLG